jgi:hypothetical protein
MNNFVSEAGACFQQAMLENVTVYGYCFQRSPKLFYWITAAMELASLVDIMESIKQLLD